MAESLFYNPVRSSKIADIANLTMDIIAHRFPTRGASPAPIPLEGKSARLLISAEKMFQEAVMALSGRECPQLGIPTVREKPWTIGWGYNQRSGTTGYGPVEFYKVGETHIRAEHRTSPKRQRFGDSFLPDLGNYDSIYYKILLNLIRDDPKKEKLLARFMLRYGRSHQPVTLQELKSIDEKADESSVDHFNQLCFLIMEKEQGQGQWQSATDERFQLGMSVAQARCLIMIEAGFIRFEEAFKNGVLFGIYSHRRIVDDPSHAAQSCKYIDELYMRYLQSKNIDDSMTFFKKHIKTDESPSLVPTREQARRDLTYAYGGGSDTDGDDEYDSDLSM